MPLPPGTASIRSPSGRTRTSTSVLPARPRSVHRHHRAERAHLVGTGELTRYPVHGADELGHERGRGVRVELVGKRDLLERAVLHHADPVGHRQRLLLVVRDEQRGDAESLLHRPDLLAQLQPDLRVERGQRLVEQQHLRLDRQRAGQRDALLLAAGELMRVAPGVLGEADHVEQLSRRAACARRPRSGASAARMRRCRARTCSGTGCSSGTPCPCPAWPRAPRRCPCRSR